MIDTEKQLKSALGQILALSELPCEDPEYVITFKCCQDRGDINGPFTGELACPTCRAREIVEKIG